MMNMQLMVVILNQVDELDPLLEALVEHGVRGATILNSTGMAKELCNCENLPIFAPLRLWLDPDREESKTILMVLKESQVPEVKQVVRSVLGDLSKPDTSILFTLPVLDVEGISGQA